MEKKAADNRTEQFFQEKIRHKTAAYFTIYTAVFAVFAFLVFIDFLRFDRTLIWEQDGISQYYPRAVYFAEYIRTLFSNLLSGNFELPMYDFSIGMGADITYSLEPLYFLFALFGEEHAEFAYNFITLIRFYFAGISASVFCLYFKKGYFATLLASVIYVFSGFALYGGARHTMFMIPMIMLPLLLLAMEEILRGRRWYLCTIFAAVSLLSNYYYLYMNTIAMGIYFLVRFFCQSDKEKKTLRNFLLKGLTICGSYLLGVAMSCIVLVTTFGQYVGSARNGSAIIKTPSLFYYSKEWLVRCFLSFLTTANSPGEWLKLGFLPISFVAVVFLFTRKGKKELKILSVIGLIFMSFPIFGFIFSGFSFVQNRWCYMLALLVAYITADVFPLLFSMKKKEVVIIGGFIGLYGYLSYFGNYLTTKYTKLAFLCLVLTFGVVLLCHDSVRNLSQLIKKGMILGLCAVMVLVNGHTFFSTSGAVKEYADPGEAAKKSTDTPLAAVDQLKDDGFYRSVSLETPFDALSASLQLDYNGISMFNSTINGNIIEYLNEMGCTSFGGTTIYGLDNRTFLNALAAVKYCGYYEDAERTLPYGYEEVLKTEQNGENAIICENQYTLPLGYTYEDTISREELEQYNVLERQEVLMQKVLLDSEEKSSGDDAEITSQGLEILSVEENGIHVTETSLTADDSEEHLLTLEFESLPNSETYLVLENAVLEGDGSENPIQIYFETEGNSYKYRFRSDDDRYGTGQEDFAFNLGYHEEPITSCTIRMSRQGTIEFESMKLYSQSMENAEAYTDARKEAVLENLELKVNTVSGSISLKEDRILVLSIPYQNGWTAYVDGQRVEPVKANYMYIGIPLTEGEHTIELEFAISGLKYALVIMPGAVVLFIGLCFISARRKRKAVVKNGKKEK